MPSRIPLWWSCSRLRSLHKKWLLLRMWKWNWMYCLLHGNLWRNCFRRWKHLSSISRLISYSTLSFSDCQSGTYFELGECKECTGKCSECSLTIFEDYACLECPPNYKLYNNGCVANLIEDCKDSTFALASNCIDVTEVNENCLYVNANLAKE